MWGRNRRNDDHLRLTGDRLTKLLGLDALATGTNVALHNETPLLVADPALRSEDETRSLPVIQNPPSPSAYEQGPDLSIEPVALSLQALQRQLQLSQIEGVRETARSVSEMVIQKTDEALNAPLVSVAQQAADDLFLRTEVAPAGETRSTQLPDHAAADELHAFTENQLADFSAKSQRLLDDQARLFERKLAEMADRTLSQSEADVHRIISRLETGFAQAKAIQASLGGSLASLGRQAAEAAQTQMGALEEDLSKVAELIESQVTVGLEPVTNRIQQCRAQAEEISSTLQLSLARVSQEATEAMLKQSQMFEEQLAALSGRAVIEVQEKVESRASDLRISSLRVLEDDLRSLSERLQQQHVATFGQSLDETFESSRAKLQVLQQKFSTYSTELLVRTRTESENMAGNFHERIQSDAQSVAATMVSTMRGRMQKLTDEFSKMFDGAFTERGS